ncbi:hypothetical protein KP509_06G031300 [Ceratopteris richardii]|nr:hypothetical protein KP509_06G031300 [Ceratopteris richardii]
MTKTRNWVVAMKSLILTHRLLREGDAAFEKELMLLRRQGTRVLNICDFRDETHANGWDFSCFLHAYGLYLDQRLECSFLGLLGAQWRSERKVSFNASKYNYSDSKNRSKRHELPVFRSEEIKQFSKENSRSFKDMKLSELMERLPVFQRLLELMTACKPTGPAKVHRLVSIALYGVLRESFLLYEDVRDGLKTIRDAFWNMDFQNCARILVINVKAAKQIADLISFYSFCKALGVCKTSEYPSVEAITGELLDEMEDFLRDTSRGKGSKGRSIQEDIEEDIKGKEKSMSNVEAQISPSGSEPILTTIPKEVSSHRSFRIASTAEQPKESSGDPGDQLAFVLFSGSADNHQEKWDPFPERGEISIPIKESDIRVAGWELALTDAKYELPKSNASSLLRGYDNLASGSTSLWQGFDHQSIPRPTLPVFRTRSVSWSEPNLSAHPPTSFPSESISAGVFTASMNAPPDTQTYVSGFQQQQQLQLLARQRQEWMRYQQSGLQEHAGIRFSSTNSFTEGFQYASTYPLPCHNTNPFCV